MTEGDEVVGVHNSLVRHNEPEAAGIGARSTIRARDLIRRLDRSTKGTTDEPSHVDVNAVITDAVKATRPR